MGVVKRTGIVIVSLLVVVGIVIAAVGTFKKNESPVVSNAASTSTSSKTIDTICQPTQYKDACVSTLQNVGPDASLKDYLEAAVKAILDEVRKALKVTNKVVIDKDDDPYNDKDGIEGCKDFLKQAIDQLDASVSEMLKSDIHTIQKKTHDFIAWLTGANIYMQTCIGELEKDEYKLAVGDGMVSATQLTDNALYIFAKIKEVLGNLDIADTLSNFFEGNFTTENSRFLLEDDSGFPQWVSNGDRRLLQLGAPLPRPHRGGRARARAEAEAQAQAQAQAQPNNGLISGIINGGIAAITGDKGLLGGILNGGVGSGTPNNGVGSVPPTAGVPVVPPTVGSVPPPAEVPVVPPTVGTVPPTEGVPVVPPTVGSVPPTAGVPVVPPTVGSVPPTVGGPVVPPTVGVPVVPPTLAGVGSIPPTAGVAVVPPTLDAGIVAAPSAAGIVAAPPTTGVDAAPPTAGVAFVPPTEGVVAAPPMAGVPSAPPTADPATPTVDPATPTADPATPTTDLDAASNIPGATPAPPTVAYFGLPPTTTIGQVQPDLVVAQDGTGQFRTIMEAVNAIPMPITKRFVIYVKAGIYNEIVAIKNKHNLMLMGDGIGKTIITGNQCHTGGVKTSSTATVAVDSDFFIAKGITFENTAGSEGHQAVALRINGEKAVVFECEMRSHQDTLYYHKGLQFYKNCIISGTVDFIFGNGRAIIQDSLIVARLPGPNQANMITADGGLNPVGQHGLVIQNCKLVADPQLMAAKASTKTFLGRPWKEYAVTVFLQNDIDDFIVPQGYSIFTNIGPGSTNQDTSIYGEYMNMGPGSNCAVRDRATFPRFKVLSPEEAQGYTVQSYLDGQAWLPASGVPFKNGL